MQPLETLTSYITYARSKIHPVLTEGASEALVQAYVEMRKAGMDSRTQEKRITATTRQLESMIRLGEAHARMRLSDRVEEEDIREAVRLIKSALRESAVRLLLCLSSPHKTDYIFNRPILSRARLILTLSTPEPVRPCVVSEPILNVRLLDSSSKKPDLKVFAGPQQSTSSTNNPVFPWIMPSSRRLLGNWRKRALSRLWVKGKEESSRVWVCNSSVNGIFFIIFHFSIMWCLFLFFCLVQCLHKAYQKLVLHYGPRSLPSTKVP